MLNMVLMPVLAKKATDSLYLILTRKNTDFRHIIEQQFSLDLSLNYLTLIA
jgi:hypothetical protein